MRFQKKVWFQDGVRDTCQIADQALQRESLDRSSGDRFVEVVHVGLVVTAVVDLHGQCVDMGFERVLRVGEGGKFVGHK
jgi:hypothetical protein